MPTLVDMTGQVFGRLVVVARVPGAWLCRCTCGNEVTVVRTSLVKGKTKSCGCLYRETRTVLRGLRRTDTPGYLAAHMRVAKARGRAADRVCGCGDQAVDWAYTHEDPAELSAPDPRTGRVRHYSAEPEFYVALCRPCHTKFDAPHRGALV